MSQAWAPQSMYGETWARCEFHESAGMSQPALGPKIRIIRSVPIRPASIAALAAMGAPR